MSDEPRASRCPICDRICAVDAEARKFHPFCSQRCQTVDLVRWLDGKYTIASNLDLDDEVWDDENIERSFDGDADQ